jgi:hypothetical protein
MLTMLVARVSRSMRRTRWFEGAEWGRFRPQGLTRIKASRGRAPVTSGHTHAGERFPNTVGLTFKAGGRAPSFLTMHRPKIWDFYSLPSTSALASRFFRFLAPATPPPLSPELRTKAHHRHVELDMLQCDLLDAAPPRRSRASPSTHRRRGVEGARGGVHAAPAQGVRRLIRGFPQAQLLCPHQAVHLSGPLLV